MDDVVSHVSLLWAFATSLSLLGSSQHAAVLCCAVLRLGLVQALQTQRAQDAAQLKTLVSEKQRLQAA